MRTLYEPIEEGIAVHQLIEEALRFAAVRHDGQFRKGTNIPYLTQAVSEPVKHLSWEERKRMTVQHVQTMQYDEVALLAADKLHNLRSIRLDVESAGEHVWDRFRRRRSSSHSRPS
ncbi:hypothetical protein [Exiguobacterium sp. AM39-5BH]|uniref:hypothetical protein n=1 Tax=Exiguobacterium sp. AM39-5BH TaxID=2292355 RepID=UPI001F27D421|nr:hypothetical protein [Exiguobacterium sp. AM39-5BH]